MLKSTLNAWTPDNRNTDVPRAVYQDPNGNMKESDRFLENGDFVRLRLAQWHIDASDADVRLTVYAENGYSCHGEMVSSQRLRGAVRAVVRQRVAMPRSRTVRFGLQGTLPSGTRIGNINMS